jgi:SPP1 family phage portal protein
MDVKNLMSGNETQVASALREAIRSDQSSKAKGKARIGQRYYDYKHDILKNRIFYLDKNDKLREDTYASNIRIPHPFFTEQVEQKVQTLLSKPLEVTAEDEKFQALLDEYYNEDMQVFLQEMVEGAAIKGVEFAYARTTSDDRLCFEVSDSLQTFDVYDENNDRQATIRYYEKEITKDGKSSTLKFAEIWTAKDVTFYRAVDDGAYKLDANQPQNPRPHVLAIADDGSQLGRSYGDIPFYRMTNNAKEKTDLEPIKPLIDDYDLMACFLSNNLQDFAEAIYVVKGFQGDDLDKLRQNIKSKKTVGVAPDGGVDIQTVQIPVEARQTKLDIDKEAIYHFGMAFDSTQVADSNGTVTNVAIQSGYSLLNMKCNKAETRLRALLRWMNQLIVEDIKRRTNKAYDVDAHFTLNLVNGFNNFVEGNIIYCLRSDFHSVAHHTRIVD